MQHDYYHNKNILVLGSSFGIGEELSRQLDKLGANLALVARSQEKLTALNQSLNNRHIVITADANNASDLHNLAAALTHKWQHIDIILFCAGSYTPMNINDFNLAIAHELIANNLTTCLNFIEAFLPWLQSSKVKHLAIISSTAGYFGMPNSLAYGASKAALSNFTESLYHELKQYKTKVQLISPGFVKTRLTAKNSFKMPGIISSQQAAKKIIKQLPTSRFEIAVPFVFTSVMKLLSLLPYKMRFWIFSLMK